jgi:quinol monooxygenase YgiN
MIFIVVKYAVKAAAIDHWLQAADAFTQATRAEAGNLWFEWYRSTEEPDSFLLVEAFRDAAAGQAHVTSPHFSAGLAALRPLLRRTPEIISQTLPDKTGWDTMSELRID